MGVRNAAPRCPRSRIPGTYYRTIATAEWGGFLPDRRPAMIFTAVRAFRRRSRPRGPPLSAGLWRTQRTGQVGPRGRVGIHQKKCDGLLELLRRVGLGKKLAWLDEQGLHPVVDGRARGVKDGQMGTPFPGVLSRLQSGLGIIPECDVDE